MNTSTLHYSFFKSPFDTVLVASSSKGITHVLFGDNQKMLLENLQKGTNASLIKEVVPAHKEVGDFINGRIPKLSVKLAPEGTPFQVRVWKEIRKSKPGKTLTYKDIAEKLGDPKLARAVGSAVGKNNLGFLVPCHRVLPANGKVGEFRWGTARKEKMLGKEKISR